MTLARQCLVSVVLITASLILGNFNTEQIVLATPPSAATIEQSMSKLKTAQKRWIEIDLSSQRLIAWEGNKPTYAVIVSTGKKVTPTLTGVFAIQSKRQSDRMKGDDYDIPDVPFILYYDRGYAIHGAYWHHRFGTPISHGCINVAVNHAQWLFNWSSVGTPVIVHP